MEEQYDPLPIEAAVQAHWAKQATFITSENDEKEKFYCLAMFPYPSGSLHMGHVRNYTIADVIARYQRMQGKNVMYPLGWDAFGLPAENAALQQGIAPAEWTYKNINRMKQQLAMLGLSCDSSREVTTCDPDYYRWEQWFFIQLYKKGLAYKKKAAVNWCPHHNTVLANEQVINGGCWRCDTRVVQKSIPQWFLKITAYADSLLEDLDTLSGWPEQVKLMQRNWIGRSEGLDIDFLAETGDKITIYTTRPDTIMGVTFLVCAPEHPYIQQQLAADAAYQGFVKQVKAASLSESTLSERDHIGMPTGLSAQHPITGVWLPIWLGNFVLMEYGCGAVMAVPAHDERDNAFARHYQLPILPVISLPDGALPDCSMEAYTDTGCLCHSGQYDGLSVEAAQKAISEALIETKQGRKAVTFRLRDWAISRQRYWGAPIPMLTLDDGSIVSVPETELPVQLPNRDSSQATHNPLVDNPAWRQTTYRGGAALRETDTFDTFMESSWYYARYTCPKASEKMFEPAAANYWLPVDQYVGGIEHATMHLIYFRFFHKALRDAGLVQGDEPAKRLLCQGMVLAEAFYYFSDQGHRVWVAPSELIFSRDARGAVIGIRDQLGRKVFSSGLSKMSKSKNNGIDPESMVSAYGADTIRLFIMFAAPPEASLEWQITGVEGAQRFLTRLWRLCYRHSRVNVAELPSIKGQSMAQKDMRTRAHRMLAKVTDDFDRRQSFNTAIAAMMEFMNHLSAFEVASREDTAVRQESLLLLVQVLYPITPHICFTLWKALTGADTVDTAAWPEVDLRALAEQDQLIVIQINGKVRAKLTVSHDATEDQIVTLSKAHSAVVKHLQTSGRQRHIYVPGKLINWVIE